jgi:hypothetical protein
MTLMVFSGAGRRFARRPKAARSHSLERSYDLRSGATIYRDKVSVGHHAPASLTPSLVRRAMDGIYRGKPC